MDEATGWRLATQAIAEVDGDVPEDGHTFVVQIDHVWMTSRAANAINAVLILRGYSHIRVMRNTGFRA